MKGTKLWNAPRSPLIQGRSRRESAYSSDWLSGTLVALAVSSVATGLFFADKGASVMAMATQVLPPSLLGSAVGGALGVSVATGFGWRPRWISGAMFGTGFGVLGVVAFVAVGIQLFGV